MKRIMLIAVGLVAALALGACTQKQESASAPHAEQPIAAGEAGKMPADHPPLDTQQGHGSGTMGGGMMGGAASAGPRQVEVPENVSTAWKAVVLQIGNKTSGSSEDVTVEIGQSVEVSGLSISVQNFLPHFTMGGGVITSASNDTVNPAAQMLVKEGEKEIFSGWLFSLYPDAHPMEHETYSVMLKDFVKAE